MRGAQRPRVSYFPPFESTAAGREAVELAEHIGLKLDPWEAWVLEHGCAERPDGRWAATEVGLCVPRQNGKGSILEAREIAGLFLFGEQTIAHSAHEYKTSLEHQRRLENLIKDCPDLHKRVKPRGGYVHANGKEAIELRDGRRIRFFTRTKSGGRGLTGDLVVFDEAMIIAQTAIGALMPTLSAKSEHGNPQIWYTGSAVDKTIHEHGGHFSRVRARALSGDDPALAYMEWSVECDGPDQLSVTAALDRESWATANPGLGIRISADWIANEQRSMDHRTFVTERLGGGDWETDADGQSVISLPAWRALTDPESRLEGSPVFAFDVSPMREWATISAAGERADGFRHLEVVDRRPGTGWVIERLRELAKTHDATAVVYDEIGPAGSLIQDDVDLGCPMVAVNGGFYAEACGMIYDAVDQSTIRHLGTSELENAVRGAAIRPLGDRWAWGRKTSSVDITPLVSVTLAHWGFATTKRAEPVVVWA